MSEDRVRVGGLEVDRAPVTNERYRAFVEATGHRPPAYWPRGTCPESLLDHPVVGVDLFDALAFARWAGGRLPTAEEWLAASGRTAGYPWGPEFDASRCNTVRSGRKGTSPVGAYPEGAGPTGCVDLSGNVWELTTTRAADDAVLAKGGSWYDYPAQARLQASASAPVHRGGATVGFRLVYGEGEECAWLPTELIDRCVEFRRKTPGATPAEAAEDFAAVVQELRLAATARLHRLHEVASADLLPPDAAVSGVEAFFAAEAGADEPPPAPVPPLADLARPHLERAADAARRHAAALGLVAAVAVLLLTVVAAPGPRAPLSVESGPPPETPPPPGAPVLVDAQPRSGLVAFFGDPARPGIETARDAARAHGVAFTAVYTGTLGPRALVERHGAAIGAVSLFVDTDGSLARRCGVSEPPALAGIRDGGKVAFVHRGRADAERALRLARALTLP